MAEADESRPAADAGRASRSSRRGWLGLVIGVLVASGALAAVLHGGGGGQGDAGDDGGGRGSERSVSIEEERTVTSHEWPPSYAGPVWITVDAPDATPRTITIRWGPWQRRIVHESAEPVTYEFAKSPDDVGEPTVPTNVRVEPAAEVEFGSGPPPAGAVDVNPGWTRVDG